MRIVSWFSCGNNSAVASKLSLELFPNDELTIARIVIDNEHPDNERFHADCEHWFGHEILRLRSDEYRDCWDVWQRNSYISGIKGAPCTTELKKAVRWQFERDWKPDAQVFGYSADEAKRSNIFTANNPDVLLLPVLGLEGITKTECAALVAGAGITLPAMYRLGFRNNNCICCAKATSIVYWARCRHYFPEQFWRMARLSRRLGCRLTRLKGVRIFLDEIPADIDWQKKERERIECGPLCAT